VSGEERAAARGDGFAVPDEGAKPIELLVLGLGNVLCGDDGLGIAAAARLERAFEAPEGVRVADGGTLGLTLLALLESSRQVLIVDAVRTGGAPGEAVRLAGDEVPPAVRERLSPHQVGVADLIDALRLRGTYPETLILLGLVPETLELGLGRSAAVEEGLPRLVERIVEEAHELGWNFTPRGATAPVAGPRDDVLRALGL